MRVLVFCNLGSRDIALNGQTIYPARQEGKRLLARYHELHDAISLPIIEPALRFILEQQQLTRERGRKKAKPPSSNRLIERLVLFGTDQSDPRYQDSDTLYSAEVAARRLPELFPDKLAAIDVVRVADINPALYDEAFEAYDTYLSRYKAAEEDICYIILTGGIPACNTALLLQGVRHFGRSLRVVYQPKEGKARELRVGAQLLNTFDEIIALDRLQHHDFANALPILERLRVHPEIVHLCRYAAQRMAFDFASARLAYDAAMRDGGRETRRFLRDHETILQLNTLLTTQEGPQINEDRMRSLLQELFWNASVTYRHHRYADFLGRVYRFQEATLRYLVETIFRMPTDLNPRYKQQTQVQWEAAIQANSHLLAYLESVQVDGAPLDWRRISRPAFQALVAYAINKRGLDAAGKPLVPDREVGRLKSLLKLLNGLDELVALRHRTIIGHDFEGVSEEDLLQAFSPAANERHPVDRLQNILAKLHIPTQPDPYSIVSNFISTQIS